MRFRRLSALSVASVVSLALLAVPALAGQTLPPPAATHTAAGGCQLGTVGTPTDDTPLILRPSDVYFVLLEPNSCPTCPPGGLALGSSRILLKFTQPCEINVTVSIVRAIESSPGCLEPDRVAEPLCSPVHQVIGDGGNVGTCQEVALPLPAGCCITDPAFLRVQFDQGSCPELEPQFCTAGTCTTCTVFNLVPGSTILDDLCVAYPDFGLLMNVDAQCCSTTPTLPGSWGRLKTLYR